MNNEIKYVHQFRGYVRSEVCSVLDENDKWRELAAVLGYSVREVEHVDRIARNRSPSDVFLELWGQKAPTLHKLFIALSQIQHYQALILLKDYVPEELHALIYEGEENLDKEDEDNEAEPEHYHSSDSNNSVNQNNDVPKQFHTKLTNINRSSVGNDSVSSKEGVHQPHYSRRGKLAEEQGSPRAANNDSEMLQVISEAHRQLRISAPPACFVPPEASTASRHAPLSPCTCTLLHTECPETNCSQADENVTSSVSTLSIAGMPSSITKTSASSSGPARRVLGSSVTSKKLILGV